MPGDGNTVLSNHAALHQTSYRAAVASMINAIKTDHGESDQDVADRLGTSATTINNASNKRGDLSAVTLLRVGKEYGLHRLGSVMGLIGGKATPVEAVCTSDLHLPVGAARGQLFLAKALGDQRIDDNEIFEGGADIEAAYETFGTLKWRLDGVRARRAS
jgi:transcriptional regulator with XRE-family HTH domain